VLVSSVPVGVFQVCVTLGTEAQLGGLSRRGAERVDSSVRVSDLVPTIGIKR
jgi:hypothetical protein